MGVELWRHVYALQSIFGAFTSHNLVASGVSLLEKTCLVR